ncbi:MAG: hypothetical protein INR70_10585 [Parafilimonas terrae]|nr:hypothetical protein [Parafilimonas terrae]
MSGLSGLRNIAKAVPSEAMDELVPQNPNPPVHPQFKPETREGWGPRQRGHMQPVLGTIDDEDALRALTLSGTGWLHKDGRFVANGTFDERETLRVAPDMAPVYERYEAERAAVDARKKAEWDVLLLLHGTMDKLIEANEEHDYVSRVRENNLYPNILSAIADAGWIKLRLWRPEGEKHITAERKPTEDNLYEPHLVALCEKLGGKLHNPAVKVSPPSPAPLPEPDAEAATRAERFAELGLLSDQIALAEEMIRNGVVPEEVLQTLGWDDPDAVQGPRF